MKWGRERRGPTAADTAATQQEWEQDCLAGLQRTFLALIAKCEVNKPFLPAGKCAFNKETLQGEDESYCAREQGTLINSTAERGFGDSPLQTNTTPLAAPRKTRSLWEGCGWSNSEGCWVPSSDSGLLSSI